MTLPLADGMIMGILCLQELISAVDRKILPYPFHILDVKGNE
jgi:hypothetical protein